MTMRHMREALERLGREDQALLGSCLEDLLKTEKGRVFLWFLLSATSPFDEPPADNALALAEASGRRKVGQALAQALMAVDPGAVGDILAWGARRAAARMKEVQSERRSGS